MAGPWYFVGVDRTGHKCPYCCDAFAKQVDNVCRPSCESSSAYKYLCTPAPLDVDCWYYSSVSAPPSVQIEWNSFYFGSSTDPGDCFGTVPTVNAAGWATLAVPACSQVKAVMSQACGSDSISLCDPEPGGCYSNCVGFAWVSWYCAGCTVCSQSSGGGCECSCDDTIGGCESVCHPCLCPNGDPCDEFGECSGCDMETVGAAPDCGVCSFADLDEFCEWECVPLRSCATGFAAICTSSGLFCRCNVNSDCCTGPQAAGYIWHSSDSQCKPCYEPSVSSSDCCSLESGAYVQKHCSADYRCCPDGRCYPSSTVVCRADAFLEDWQDPGWPESYE